MKFRLFFLLWGLRLRLLGLGLGNVQCYGVGFEVRIGGSEFYSLGLGHVVGGLGCRVEGYKSFQFPRLSIISLKPFQPLTYVAPSACNSNNLNPTCTQT